MKSTYKRIGDFIKLVDERNKGLTVTDLKGIRINKEFMPSVANIQGTDLTKYKVVSKYQFSYNPLHVGRDAVLPISMLDREEPVIVSPAYVVFEVTDPNILHPEYLMMWFRRPEFDRNAWFMTDSSIRGGFGWDDFCEMTLPVPPIKKQRAIVREYNTIVNRIKLNEQLNQKLEETAQAIYKQWFVNFEFPISAEYAADMGKPELEGRSYKSSGGEMVYGEEVDMEYPSGWGVSDLGNIASKIVDNRGKTPPLDSNGERFLLETFLLEENQTFPLMRENPKNKYVSQETYDNWFRTGHPQYLDILFGTVGNGIPNWSLVPKDCNFCIAQNIIALRVKKNVSPFYTLLFFNTSLFKSQFKGRVKDTAQPSIRVSDIKTIKIVIATFDLMEQFHTLVSPLYEMIEKRIRENCNQHNLTKILINNLINTR